MLAVLLQDVIIIWNFYFGVRVRLREVLNIEQLFTEVELNSGGYLPSYEAAR